MKSSLLFLFAFVLGLSGIKAQEVSEYDLQNFALSYYEMMLLNNQAQKDMAKLIMDEGLDLEAFHAIDESQSTEYEPDLPQSEYDKYDKVLPKVQQRQAKLEADVEKVFAKYDMDKKRYAAISERVKQDYLLQAKLEQIMAQLR